MAPAVGSDSVVCVAGGPYDSSITRVRPFFGALITRDRTGESWLGRLLAATPRGDAVFGERLGEPATLDPTLTAVASNDLLGCFEFGVAPPRSLLAWYVEHPDQLLWPKGKTYSEETVRMRKALLYDSAPGRADAQRQARELVEMQSPAKRGWWRFEGVSMIDCVLMTDQLVLTIEGKRTEPLSATTDWYPKRSQLVRNLEAAKQLAHGRAWASLLVSEIPVPEGSDAGLDALLPASAPHLDPASRRDLHAHYLGNITWQQACEATGIVFESLPKTTADL